MKNLLNAIEQANKLAQAFGLQFFAYVSDGEQKENLSSNLVLNDLETVIGGLREWQTGEIPRPKGPSVLIIDRQVNKCNHEQSVIVIASRYYKGLNWRTRYRKGWHWEEYYLDNFKGHRWFIQPITLPCSDHTKPKQ